MPYFVFEGPGAPRDLLSSPTRRSSDLSRPALGWTVHSALVALSPQKYSPRNVARSEEHTSELQSQSNLVCPTLFLKDPAPPEIYSLPLHDALPICRARRSAGRSTARWSRCRRRSTARGTSPDRKSTRLNSSHSQISYALLCF